MGEATDLTIETEMREITVITSADGRHRAEIFAGPAGTRSCCLIGNDEDDGIERVHMSTGWVDARKSLDEHIEDMAREVRASVGFEAKRREAAALRATDLSNEQFGPPPGGICGQITQADTPCQHRVTGSGKCAAGHLRSR